MSWVNLHSNPSYDTLLAQADIPSRPAVSFAGSRIKGEKKMYHRINKQNDAFSLIFLLFLFFFPLVPPHSPLLFPRFPPLFSSYSGLVGKSREIGYKSKTNKLSITYAYIHIREIKTPLWNPLSLRK